MAVVSPVNYLQQVRTELGKVVWPTRAETLKLTAIVILVSGGIGLFIGALDLLFVTVTQIVLKR